jgi:DNA repair protein RadD
MDLFTQPAVPAFPTPRAFQDRAHLGLRDGFKGGHRRQLLVAPTGAGKTYCGLRIINEALAKAKRALFICDRTALINQTSARADEYGIDHGIIQAQHWRRDNAKPFQIASIQTLQKREYWHPADVIVIDEAHTQHSEWVEYIQTTDAAVVGLTATPCSKGLGKSFTNMVNAATMQELTDLGVLVPMRILTCVTPDMAGAATSGGEWTAKAASEQELKIVGDVVGEWLKHAGNRKTIAFGADIAYCNELVGRFNAAGIGAAAYTNNTPDAERAELLAEFSKPNPRIRVLVSVEALAKGFDVQDIGCVIDARPLRKSLSTAIQMWGRGLRSSPDTGKTECLLLDFSGNARRFHDDFVDVYFNGFKTLDMAESLDKKVRPEQEDFVPAGCPQCSHKPFRTRCLACGFEKQSRMLVDESAGVMQEIMIGKRVAAANKSDLWAQLCTYARENIKTGKHAGWAWYKFQEITGEKPPRGWSFDSAPTVEVSSALVGKLHSLRIKYSRGRAKAEARV